MEEPAEIPQSLDDPLLIYTSLRAGCTCPQSCVNPEADTCLLSHACIRMECIIDVCWCLIALESVLVPEVSMIP